MVTKAEEKNKFYGRGLFTIKIEIVYIYIASKSCLLGVDRTDLSELFSWLSQEEWTDGWIDAEGRENRDNGGFKRGIV